MGKVGGPGGRGREDLGAVRRTKKYRGSSTSIDPTNKPVKAMTTMRQRRGIDGVSKEKDNARHPPRTMCRVGFDVKSVARASNMESIIKHGIVRSLPCSWSLIRGTVT